MKLDSHLSHGLSPPGNFQRKSKLQIFSVDYGNDAFFKEIAFLGQNRY